MNIKNFIKYKSPKYSKIMRKFVRIDNKYDFTPALKDETELYGQNNK